MAPKNTTAALLARLPPEHRAAAQRMIAAEGEAALIAIARALFKDQPKRRRGRPRRDIAHLLAEMADLVADGSSIHSAAKTVAAAHYASEKPRIEQDSLRSSLKRAWKAGGEVALRAAKRRRQKSEPRAGAAPPAGCDVAGAFVRRFDENIPSQIPVGIAAGRHTTEEWRQRLALAEKLGSGSAIPGSDPRHRIAESLARETAMNASRAFPKEQK